MDAILAAVDFTTITTTIQGLGSGIVSIAMIFAGVKVAQRVLGRM